MYTIVCRAWTGEGYFYRGSIQQSKTWTNLSAMVQLLPWPLLFTHMSPLLSTCPFTPETVVLPDPHIMVSRYAYIVRPPRVTHGGRNKCNLVYRQTRLFDVVQCQTLPPPTVCAVPLGAAPPGSHWDLEPAAELSWAVGLSDVCCSNSSMNERNQ